MLIRMGNTRLIVANCAIVSVMGRGSFSSTLQVFAREAVEAVIKLLALATILLTSRVGPRV